MVRLILLVIMVFAAGCSSAPVKHEGSDKTQANKVYGAIKRLLQQGTTVNVMVDYTSSYSGLPEGQRPGDYGYAADNETIIETEKYLLLESFSKYPNFSVIDRSRMQASINEIKLGSGGMSASSVVPGQISGATHLIVIEAKNNFKPMSGRAKDTYIEIKKLLDMQRNVVIAIDSYSETRDALYRPVRHARPAPAPEPSEPQAPERAELQQLPPRIEVTPAPMPVRPQQVETLTIHGGGPANYEAAPQPAYSAVNSPVNVSNPVNISNPPEQQMSFQQELSEKLDHVSGVRRQVQRPVRTIPDWQLARMLKQRYPDMRNKDDRTVVQRFIRNHPNFSDKVQVGPAAK